LDIKETSTIRQPLKESLAIENMLEAYKRVAVLIEDQQAEVGHVIAAAECLEDSTYYVTRFLRTQK
jgi:hypothetical protein